MKRLPICLEPALRLREVAYAWEVIAGLMGCRPEFVQAPEALGAEKGILYGGRNFLAGLAAPPGTVVVHASDFFRGDYLQENRVRDCYEDEQNGLVTFWRDEAEAPVNGAPYISGDIAASAFVLLTLYEERFGPWTGPYQTFDRTHSLAERFGLQFRPVVHEYARGLARKLGLEDDGAARPPSPPRVLLGVDVDYRSMRDVMRLQGFGSLLRDPRSLWKWLRRDGSNLGNLYDYFERRGITSTLFVLRRFHPEHDQGAEYRIKPALLRRWDEAHEVALHTSIEGADDRALIREELDSLSNDLHRRPLGVRQHYLGMKWGPRCWDILDELGLKYDASVALRHSVGLRNGMMSPYRVFSLQRKKPLELIEFPCGFSDQWFRRVRSEQDYEKVVAQWNMLRELARRHGAGLALMWHNTTFSDLLAPRAVRFFEQHMLGAGVAFGSFREAVRQLPSA